VAGVHVAIAARISVNPQYLTPARRVHAQYCVHVRARPPMHVYLCSLLLVCSPKLHRVSYQVSSRQMLEEALDALTDMKELRQLELVVKNFMLCADQLRTIGEASGTRVSFACMLGEKASTLVCAASTIPSAAVSSPRPIPVHGSVWRGSMRVRQLPERCTAQGCRKYVWGLQRCKQARLLW